MGKKVSVIIPCYNVGNFIDRCMDSVIKQTYGLSNLEIICVNDASTDDTLDHLMKWESQYPENICVIPLESNQMLGAARNIGLNQASGEYITFIDSDDWLDTRFIEIMMAVAEAENVDMVRCNHIRDYTSVADTVIGSLVSPGNLSYQCCLIDTEDKRKNAIRIMSQNLTAWGKIIRKAFLTDNNIYFPEGLAYEDNLWGPLLYLYLDKYCVIDMQMYHYYVNDSSLSLKMNAPHHPDFLSVQLMKWNELVSRGFYDKYADEINYDFLHSCFLDFMKLICVRFDPPSYSLFRLMKEIVTEHIPDYEANPYIDQGFTDFQKILLELLKTNTDKASFYQFAEYVRKLGI